MIVYPPIAPDSTDVSVYFRAAEASTGTNPGDPVTVTSATAGISLSYRRRGATPVAISLSDLSALTAAHTDGGLLVVGDGVHRLDVPDAAFASGSDDVVIFGSATDIVFFGPLIPLGVPADSIDANALTSSALAAIQNEVITALTTEDIAQGTPILSRLPSALSASGHMPADVQTIKETGLTAPPPPFSTT